MQGYQQEGHCNNPGERLWQEEGTVEKQRKKELDSGSGAEMYLS